MSTPPTSPWRRAVFWTVLAVVVASVFAVLRVDFNPQVESDFFFASDDPQLRASERIAELFPTSGQILVSAVAPDLGSPEYVERVGALTDALGAVEGVRAVRSLTSGPPNPGAVPESPFWRRLLLGDVANLSLLVVEVDDLADNAARSRRIAAIESIVGEHQRPSFSLRLSGVPYIVEQIRLQLRRDLRVFSTASLIVFGLMVAAVYRSWRIVAGTLAACLGACCLTLTILHLLGTPIGLLTANLVTIVFVLTLSHIVFLNANWRYLGAQDQSSDTPPDALAAQAVERTLQASFWCMVTTLLGFASLLFASARPLRELGLAGALGAAVAIVVAYALYPAVLARLPRSEARHAKLSRAVSRPPRLQTVWLVAVAAAVVFAAFGLRKVDTDPSLFAYFPAGGEIRPGLELIDTNGGSSPLQIVVRDAGERLDTTDALDRMEALQNALEKDSDVGVALSPPILVAEARRVPLARFLSPEKIFDALSSPLFGNVARSFLTEDRTLGLYLLLLREDSRTTSRREVVERLSAKVAEADLEIELIGGIYDLQGQLGELVATSLVNGLGALLALFLVIAALVARVPRWVLAMVACLAAVPVLVLGTLGHLGLPLDVIASPAANVAIALGIDSMIHLVSAVRRRRANGENDGDAWAAACGDLWQPILGATLILAGGFGIFALSSFPPTQRFGVAVAFGTAAAAAMTLGVLPSLAQRGSGDTARATRA